MSNIEIIITDKDLGRRRANRKEMGKCPFCLSDIQFGEYITKCKKCDIIYHQQCWDKNDGCGTYGCKELITNVAPEPPQTSPCVQFPDYMPTVFKNWLIVGIVCILLFIFLIFILISIID